MIEGKMTESELMRDISHRLADRSISEEGVAALADMVFSSDLAVVHYDVCKYGTCWEFKVPGGLAQLDLARILKIVPGRVRGVDIMIDGIVNPEALRVRVAQEIR